MINRDIAYRVMINSIRLACVAAFAIAIYDRRFSLLFGITLTFFSTFLPYIFERKTQLKIPLLFQTIVVLFIFASLFLGEFVGFYDRFFWWDAFLHSASAFAFGLLGFTILYILVQRKQIVASPLTLAIFAFFFAIGIGALWEIVEFFVDRVFGASMQRNSLEDTMGDMIVNAIGSLLAIIFSYRYLRGGFQFRAFEPWKEFFYKNKGRFRRLLQ